MRRRTMLATAAALAVALVGVSGFVGTAPASADVCDNIPSLPLVPNPIKLGCKVVTKVPSVIANPGSIITAPLKAAGDAVMQQVTSWVADGAAWLLGEAGKLIDATTTPVLSAPWFTGQYQTMAALAAVFALPLLLLSVLQGVLRRDSAVIVRAAFVHLPAAFLLTGGAVVVVGLFVGLTDQMCSTVAQSVGGNAKTFFAHVGQSLTSLGAATGTGPVIPLFAVFLGGLIAAVGAFFVWVELLIRSAAIYVAVLFLPFTFVAMIWPHTARWCRRLVELLFAIVFAKFVIVAIMALAAAGLLSAGTGQGFGAVLAGTALMILAAFSPFALLRLIPLVEGAAHASSRSGAGAQTLGPVAGPAAVMRRVVDGNWGGGGTLRAAPAAAAAGPAGVALAGGAQATAGGARAGAQRATDTMASAARTGANGNGHAGGRYAAVAGGAAGTARPAAPQPASTPGAEPNGTPAPGSGSTSGAGAPPPTSLTPSPTATRPSSDVSGPAARPSPGSPLAAPRDPASERFDAERRRGGDGR
jgi:type IV secretion system protein TrbL